MLTCLCDAFFGEVGIATVRVLEHVGCEVVFNRDQTCCGQPPFNAGDWKAARTIASHCGKVLDLQGPEPIVTPSGSCAAMLREGYPMLFEGMEHPCCFELAEFLVKQMGIERWPGQPV
jgi:L-lactate dehydrogenase complex protein LldE